MKFGKSHRVWCVPLKKLPKKLLRRISYLSGMHTNWHTNVYLFIGMGWGNVLLTWITFVAATKTQCLFGHRVNYICQRYRFNVQKSGLACLELLFLERTFLSFFFLVDVGLGICTSEWQGAPGCKKAPSKLKCDTYVMSGKLYVCMSCLTEKTYLISR